MLELLLLRHAKAVPDAGGEGDLARDLAPEGVEAARRVGQLMREEALVPDLVLCSPATRAQRSWELVRQALGAQPSTQAMPELYLASPALLRAVVERQPSVSRLMLVGHNPGLHAFARRLVGAGQGSRELAAELPTAALLRFGFEVEAWSGIRLGQGRLLGYWRPTAD